MTTQAHRREERAQAIQGLRAHSHTLAREARGARTATLRAMRGAIADVSASERAERAAAAAIIRAWGRPPRGRVIRRLQARGLLAGAPRRRGGDGDGRTSVHFRLGTSASADASRAHQRYIERTGACVASFGNIADDATERERLWRAIAERSHRRRGTIRAGTEVAPEVKRALIAAAAADLEGLGIPTGALAAAQRIVRTADHAALANLALTLQTPDRATHNAVMSKAYEAAGVTLDPKKPKTGSKIPGISDYAPREPIVQRRLVLELPHELELSEMIRALRTWCTQTLGKAQVGWHATIHRPEGGNDVRNWHAHVVFTQCKIEHTEINGRPAFGFETSTKRPDPTETIKNLAGNGPDKRVGARATIMGWRTQWCEALNDALARAGETKRYDPRSYADRGIDRTPGRHRGTIRSATDERDRRNSETPKGPEPDDPDPPTRNEADELWAQARDALRARTTNDEEEEREAALDALDRLRLKAGLEGEPGAIALRLRTWLENDAAHTPPDSLAEAIDTMASDAPQPAALRWRTAWETTEAKGLTRDARGQAAEILAEEAGGASVIEAFASEEDAPQSLRALATAVIGHRARKRAWQHRAAPVDDTANEGAESDAIALDIEDKAKEEGAELTILLGKRLAARVAAGAHRARRAALADAQWEQTRTGMERGASPEKIATIGTQLSTAHATHFKEDRPARGQAFNAWVKDCMAAARLRKTFQHGCRSDNADFTAFHQLYASDDAQMERARALLTNEERQAMEQVAGGNPAEARERYRTVQKSVQTLRTTLYPQGNEAGIDLVALDETLRDPVSKARIAEVAPGWLAHLEAIARETERRRQHLEHHLSEAESDDIAVAGRAAAIAKHEYDDLVAIDHPKQDAMLEMIAKRWAEHIQSRIEAATAEPRADIRDRMIAGLATAQALEALAQRAPETARIVSVAAQAELEHRQQTRTRVAEAQSHLQSKSAAERRKGHVTLREILNDAVHRSRLAPGETERLRRMIQSQPQTLRST